jgi:transposase InsO family protein
MKQIARNLTDAIDGFLNGTRFLLIDRDGKFCPAFHRMLKDSGVEPVLLPPKSPNLNAHLERFHKSIKSECLDRMIFFGEQSLRNAVAGYLRHHHVERNHQGLGNRLIEPGEEVGRTEGDVLCRERLGDMLRYYYRKAA